MPWLLCLWHFLFVWIGRSFAAHTGRARVCGWCVGVELGLGFGLVFLLRLLASAPPLASLGSACGGSWFCVSLFTSSGSGAPLAEPLSAPSLPSSSAWCISCSQHNDSSAHTSAATKHRVKNVGGIKSRTIFTQQLLHQKHALTGAHRIEFSAIRARLFLLLNVCLHSIKPAT